MKQTNWQKKSCLKDTNNTLSPPSPPPPPSPPSFPCLPYCPALPCFPFLPQPLCIWFACFYPVLFPEFHFSFFVDSTILPLIVCYLNLLKYFCHFITSYHSISLFIYLSIYAEVTSVKSKVLDCSLKVNEFKFQSLY